MSMRGQNVKLMRVKSASEDIKMQDFDQDDERTRNNTGK